MLDGVMAAALGVVVIGVLCWWHLCGGSNGGHRKTPEAAHGHPGSSANHGSGTNVASASAGSGSFAVNPYANARQSLIGAQNVTRDQMMQAMLSQQNATAAQQQLSQQSAYFEALQRAAQAHQVVPSAPPKIEDAGIRLGEIEAWRAWRIASGFVRSTFREEVWAPGEAMTGKPATGHGVHAWPTMSAALTYGIGRNEEAIVIGRVHLWGEVIEHERGYRAEFAKIIAFDAIVAPRAQAAEIDHALVTLRERYGLGATTIEARSDETAQRARPEGRERDGEAGSP